MKDYYLVLGVPRGESPRGLRDAYRQLATRYHPDRAGPEASAAYRDVAEAYGVLSDPERRGRHDRRLRSAERRLDVAPDTIVRTADGWQPDAVSVPDGFARVRPSPAALLDRLLHNLLAERASKGERLQALDAELVLSDAEATRGGTVRLGMPVFRTCPHCRGAGGDWLHPCPVCDDQGVVETEAPVRMRIPPRARDGMFLELPLDRVGIHNLYVRLRLRVDPHL